MSALTTLTPAEEAFLGLLPDGEVLESFRSNGMPHRRLEGWRWTDLKTALRDNDGFQREKKSIREGILDLSDCFIIEIEPDGAGVFEANLPAGIRLETGEAASTTRYPHVGRLAAATTKKLKLFIDQTIERPVAVIHKSSGSGYYSAYLDVSVAGKAKCEIIELHDYDGAGFSNLLTSYFVAEQSEVTRLVYQGSASERVITSYTDVFLTAFSKLHQTTLGFGSKLSRFETHIMHSGGGSSATANAAYLLSDRKHFDLTTTVHHDAEDCITRQVCKGVIDEQATGVFQGKFYVARGAQKTDARMGHNALLLSDQAEVNAKPELEIYADDVECAHGNTAGALDDDALYYMRQRGLSEHQARAILVEAFVGEVLEGIENKSLYEQFSVKVAEFMGDSA